MTRTIRTSLGSAVFIALLVAVAIPAVALAGAKQHQPATNDLSAQFRAANLGIDDLRVVEVGGIVVIRGRSAGKVHAEAASKMARDLGYERVANLVQIIEPPDDAAIERRAERALASQRSLDGCNFRLDSDNGALLVAGTVKYELQKDMAVHVLRGVVGVRTVKSDLHQ
jgi:osmotically-inducible protein OsmY